MPELVLPFEPLEVSSDIDELVNSGLTAMLPDEMREAAIEKPFLLQYLHMLPIEEIGVPHYYANPPRSLGEDKSPM